MDRRQAIDKRQAKHSQQPNLQHHLPVQQDADDLLSVETRQLVQIQLPVGTKRQKDTSMNEINCGRQYQSNTTQQNKQMHTRFHSVVYRSHLYIIDSKGYLNVVDIQTTPTPKDARSLLQNSQHSRTSSGGLASTTHVFGGLTSTTNVFESLSLTATHSTGNTPRTPPVNDRTIIKVAIVNNFIYLLCQQSLETIQNSLKQSKPQLPKLQLVEQLKSQLVKQLPVQLDRQLTVQLDRQVKQNPQHKAQNMIISERQTLTSLKIYKYNILTRMCEELQGQLPSQINPLKGVESYNESNIVFESIFNMYLMLLLPIKKQSLRLDSGLKNKGNFKDSNPINETVEVSTEDNLQVCISQNRKEQDKLSEVRMRQQLYLQLESKLDLRQEPQLNKQLLSGPDIQSVSKFNLQPVTISKERVTQQNNGKPEVQTDKSQSRQLRGWIWMVGQWRQLKLISNYSTLTDRGQFTISQADGLLSTVAPNGKIYLLRASNSSKTENQSITQHNPQEPHQELFVMSVDLANLSLNIEHINSNQQNQLTQLTKHHPQSHLMPKLNQMSALTVLNNTLLTFLSPQNQATINKKQNFPNNQTIKLQQQTHRKNHYKKLWALNLSSLQWRQLRLRLNHSIESASRQNLVAINIHPINKQSLISVCLSQSDSQHNTAEVSLLSLSPDLLHKQPNYHQQFTPISNKKRQQSSPLYNYDILSKYSALSMEKPSCFDGESQISMTTNMLHCLSHSIRFAFHAVLRIIEFLQQQYRPQWTRFFSETTTNTINKFMYLSFQFVIAQSIRPKQRHFRDYSIPRPNQVYALFQRLFCYGLRLGKTVLMVENIPICSNLNRSSSKYLSRVTLISADSRYSPMLQHRPIFYTYTQTKNGVFPHERQKTLVIQILSTLVKDPLSVLNQQNLDKKSKESYPKMSKILVFCPNIIPTSKNYFYELVFDLGNDVSLFKNNKKVDVVEKLGYGIGNMMEGSLKAFLASRRLDLNILNQTQNNVPDKQMEDDNIQYYQGKDIKQYGKLQKMVDEGGQRECEDNTQNGELKIEEVEVKRKDREATINSERKRSNNNHNTNMGRSKGVNTNHANDSESSVDGGEFVLKLQDEAANVRTRSRNRAEKHKLKNKKHSHINTNTKRYKYHAYINNQKPNRKTTIINQEKLPANNPNCLLESSYVISPTINESVNHFNNYAKQFRDSKSPPISIYLSNSPQPIDSHPHYLSILRHQHKLKHLTKIPLHKPIPYTNYVELYMCHRDYLLRQNDGILLYSFEGNLINRYECQFGNMLMQKFYHKKLSKQNQSTNVNNIFPVIGVVSLGREFQLVNFGTQVKRDSRYAQFSLYLEEEISQFVDKNTNQRCKESREGSDDNQQKRKIINQLNQIRQGRDQTANVHFNNISSCEEFVRGNINLKRLEKSDQNKDLSACLHSIQHSLINNKSTTPLCSNNTPTTQINRKQIIQSTNQNPPDPKPQEILNQQADSRFVIQNKPIMTSHQVIALPSFRTAQNASTQTILQTQFIRYQHIGTSQNSCHIGQNLMYKKNLIHQGPSKEVVDRIQQHGPHLGQKQKTCYNPQRPF